jgi:hypothetical protein
MGVDVSVLPRPLSALRLILLGDIWTGMRSCNSHHISRHLVAFPTSGFWIEHPLMMMMQLPQLPPASELTGSARHKYERG